MRKQDLGVCEKCRKAFSYWLIHNGFDDSSYAYCDRCGMTAVLSHWSKQFPTLPADSGEIPAELESYIKPCICGGRFKKGAALRCPHCSQQLSAECATGWIENNAPGTAKGWRWQRSWRGLYAIVIENIWVKDNFVGSIPSQ
jgi:hypothetical protein